MAHPSPSTTREIVETYLKAFYREQKDYQVIDGLLDETFTFRGPMAAYPDKAEFMAFIREIGPQQNRIEIRRIIAEGDQAAVFHDYHSKTPVVGPLPFAEWYQLREGKIISLELFFDAREFAVLIAEAEARVS